MGNAIAEYEQAEPMIDVTGPESIALYIEINHINDILDFDTAMNGRKKSPAAAYSLLHWCL